MTVAQLDHAKTAPSCRGLQLSDLPDEIVAAILAFLRDTSDLINSTYVCWQFKELSEPYLYKHIEVLEEDQARRLSTAIQANEVRAKWIQSFLLSPTFGHHRGLQDLPDYLVGTPARTSNPVWLPKIVIGALFSEGRKSTMCFFPLGASS